MQKIPYCGTPPTPAELWHRWNLDPVLIAMLVILFAAYFFGARKLAREGAPLDGRTIKIFALGWIATTLALIAPICPLSVALFSARVGQHMILTLLAAPIVALGRPELAYGAFLPKGEWRTKASRRAALLGAVAFAAAIWVWHSPAPYQATFDSTFIYWTMHVTTFFAAVVLWHGIMCAPREGVIEGLCAGLFTSIQMSLLGALLTFAPKALFSAHFATAGIWGLTPLADQQLGGAIMWAPGCVLLVIIGVAGVARAMRNPEEELRPAGP